MSRFLSSALCIALALPAQVAIADTCPASVPADSRERRAAAKEWFSKAESAEAAQDLVGASKAYQCSIRMVPHAFTAFNLGRISEKAGDLELAIEAYETYLKLAPEAPDRADVEGKVAGMRARIAELSQEKPKPKPVEVAPAPAPSPEVVPREPPARFGTIGWAATGVGAAALVSGLVLNLSARSKMDSCRSLYRASEPESVWGPECDAAKPRAYASYGLFGLAGAAAVFDAVLLLRSPSDSERISFAPIPGGGAIVARGRF